MKELGRRRYVSHEDEPNGLPKPVHLAFWGALGGIVEWMEDSGTTKAVVMDWGARLTRRPVNGSSGWPTLVPSRGHVDRGYDIHVLPHLGMDSREIAAT